jgi:hypothetical protein
LIFTVANIPWLAGEDPVRQVGQTALSRTACGVAMGAVTPDPKNLARVGRYPFRAHLRTKWLSAASMARRSTGFI